MRYNDVSRRAIFLDRDGVVNRRRVGDYVKRPDEFEFLPEIFDVLPEIHAAGYLALLITNQRGISLGVMSEDDLLQVHELMQTVLDERTGHRLDAIYFCPHGKDDDCDCRKPRPGMILRAIAEHGITPVSSWMIGDSESDVEAGIAAGCRTVKIDPQMGESKAEIVVRSLSEAWQWIVRLDRAESGTE